MFFRQTKLILILTICLLSVFSFSVVEAKNAPFSLDKVNGELHPWGGDDNFNPYDNYSYSTSTSSVVIGSKNERSFVVSLWKYMVFRVEMAYFQFSRSDATSTSLGITSDSGSSGGGK